MAGETSGDLLGAGLIRAIRAQVPDARFCGVAGPAMIEAGCEAWWPSERLAVMGLGEVVRHLPDLLSLRKALRQRLLAEPPDVFVGIDAPDFNLGLEIRLKKAGVPTVHYVSPTVWAWREGRVKKIARAADTVLCLLPMEPAAYAGTGVNAVFVGHPLADSLPLETPAGPARERLGLGGDEPVIAVLPGSRLTEVNALGTDFAGAMALIARRRPTARFVVPTATGRTRDAFQACLTEAAADANVHVVDGRSHDAMAASDVVLLASGTATLEATLIKRPMVVAYRVSRMTRWILETFRLLKVGRFALPNLLAGEDLVPEFIQDAVSPRALADAVLARLADVDGNRSLVARFADLHRSLRRDASRQAARAVLTLVDARRPSAS